MAICNGKGDTDGGHCCYIGGKVCGFLFIDRGGTPRCKVWDEMDSDKWRNSPVGQMFTRRWPGFTCQDWPQNIPNPETLGGLCCWKGEL